MSHSDMQKYIFYKNAINSFKFLCTGSHERLWIRYVLSLEMTRRSFLNELYILNIIKAFQKKLKSVYSFGLSICPSVCTRSNSHKYSSNVVRFIYVVYI